MGVFMYSTLPPFLGQITHWLSLGILIENQKSVFRLENQKPVLFLWLLVFEFVFFSFSSRELHTNYQMSDKLYSHICFIHSFVHCRHLYSTSSNGTT